MLWIKVWIRHWTDSAKQSFDLQNDYLSDFYIDADGDVYFMDGNQNVLVWNLSIEMAPFIRWRDRYETLAIANFEEEPYFMPEFGIEIIRKCVISKEGLEFELRMIYGNHLDMIQSGALYHFIDNASPIEAEEDEKKKEEGSKQELLKFVHGLIVVCNILFFVNVITLK